MRLEVAEPLVLALHRGEQREQRDVLVHVREVACMMAVPVLSHVRDSTAQATGYFSPRGRFAADLPFLRAAGGLPAGLCRAGLLAGEPRPTRGLEPGARACAAVFFAAGPG